MRVRDLMSRRVVSVTPDETVAAAKRRLRERNIHHLLVIENGAVIGIVTHGHIAARADGEKLRDVMSREVLAIGPDAPIRNAASLMISGTNGCLPVMDGAKLAGIITTSDLRRAVLVGDTLH